MVNYIVIIMYINFNINKKNIDEAKYENNCCSSFEFYSNCSSLLHYNILVFINNKKLRKRIIKNMPFID